ncbi:hypothetical protein AB0C27_20330 [Nonomuraea sp. NPDC048882]|uniref:hypothetical protein n=1 Tax=Nonomuraea sp. NPDC048882 TaxID=3154347 RepID=UPI0033C3FD05
MITDKGEGTGMAQLLRRLDDEVYVEYNTFGLDGTDLPTWGSPTDEMYHFIAAVRMESWDAEPGAADDSWTPVSSATFVAKSGVIAILSMMDGKGHDFLIGPAHFEYGVSMYLREPQPGDGHATDDCEPPRHPYVLGAHRRPWRHVRTAGCQSPRVAVGGRPARR